MVYDEATVIYDEATDDVSGEPLSGVTVELVGGAGEFYRTTDGNGYYKISLRELLKENQDYPNSSLIKNGFSTTR